MGRKIGEIFLEVKEVIVLDGGGKEGNHLKLLMEMNLWEPLIRGTIVRMNWKDRWIEFRYERCPYFCYICGLIGHNQKSCGEKIENKNEKEEDQYGWWLKSQRIRNPTKKKLDGQ